MFSSFDWLKNRWPNLTIRWPIFVDPKLENQLRIRWPILAIRWPNSGFTSYGNKPIFTPKTQFSITQTPNFIGNITYDYTNTWTSIQRPNFSNNKAMNNNIWLTLIPKTHNLQLLSNPISEKTYLRFENMNPTLTLDCSSEINSSVLFS